MKRIIVGTAGHIDHGKTSLVKALTGIDADRLEEEKRRGITIDIGFAHLELAGHRFGFVDVPGHERFVRNMLAGVGGVDLVLLVIAADEGIKPQTREHFEICRLLGIKHGIIALTKSDAADAETIAARKREVAAFVAGSFLGLAPLIPVSSIDGRGLEELKTALLKTATPVQAKDAEGLFRLPIDRVFTMKGFGTVVTGTLIGGSVAKGDELEVLPSCKRIRVRSVQVHGAAEERALAGERTALNVTGVDKEELARGMTLVEPDVLRATKRIDVQLSLLKDASAVKDRARVHFHAFTSEAVAEVVLLGEKIAKPGNETFAHLRFAEPMLVLPGDRFIIRQFSPVVTIGGGVVIDAHPLKPRSMSASSEPTLRTLLRGSAPDILRHRVARRGPEGLSIAELRAETGWTSKQVEQALQPLVQENAVLRLDQTLIDTTAFMTCAEQLVQTVEGFHRENPLAPGQPRESLRGSAPEVVFNAALDRLVRTRRLETPGELVRIPGRGTVMKDDEAEAKQTIEQAFRSAGLKVPALKDVLAGLKIEKARATKIVTLLLRDRVLLKLSDDLVFHKDALALLCRALADQKKASPRIDVARFKNMTGVSRKYAIPLLEYLDRERVTRREGDVRVIL